VGIPERIKCWLIMCFVSMFNRKFRIKNVFAESRNTGSNYNAAIVSFRGTYGGRGMFVNGATTALQRLDEIELEGKCAAPVPFSPNLDNLTRRTFFV
jgi:hypothetical protein